MTFRIAFLFMLALPVYWTEVRAQEMATYRLDINVSWSVETHPFDFPPNPHLSKIIGATHDPDYAMFRDGDTGSSGLELMAERGRPSIFRIELEEAADRNLIGSIFEGDGIWDIPGEASLTFSATLAFARVSFVTMIAPSPDWITGVSGIELHDGQQWIDRLELPLWAWDAGTDSGDRYQAKNQDTQPQQSVRLVATSHFLGSHGLSKVGDIAIERIK